MNNQNKLIILLLIVILLATFVLILKKTGIIKVKQPTISTQYINEIENTVNNTSNSNSNNSLTTEELIQKEYQEFLKQEIEKEEEELREYKKRQKETNFKVKLAIIGIGILILGITIGISKLYKELGISDLISSFPIIINILFIIVALFASSSSSSGFLMVLAVIIAIIVSLMFLACECSYLKALGFSPAWAFISFVGIIPVIGKFLSIIASIAYIIISILACCKLADLFGKGILFKLGLIFLPFIFFPILGYFYSTGERK